MINNESFCLLILMDRIGDFASRKTFYNGCLTYTVE